MKITQVFDSCTGAQAMHLKRYLAQTGQTMSFGEEFSFFINLHYCTFCVWISTSWFWSFSTLRDRDTDIQTRIRGSALVWIFSNCWNYSSKIGHQNSEEKRHANPNHFRSPKVDQPWWTNWKWENLMIAWAWSATTLCQSQVFCIFSAFSLGYFREAVYLSP